MGKDHRIHSCRLEHIDILSLLLFIGDIVDGLLLLLLFPGAFSFCSISLSSLLAIGDYLGLDLLTVLIHSGLRLRLLRILGLHLQAFGQCKVPAVQVLEEDVIIHLLTELVILQAAEFDEGADVIPVFVVFLLLGLAHARELVCHLLGDILGYLLHKPVVLQGTPGHIKGQVRAVNDTL